MSTFRAEAESRSQHVDRVPCRVGVFLDGLPDADRVEVADAIDDLELTAPALAATIWAHYAVDIRHEVVARHRRRLTNGNGCKCPVSDALEVAA